MKLFPFISALLMAKSCAVQPVVDEIHRYCDILTSDASIAEKCSTMIKLSDKWEEVAPDDDYYNSLSVEARATLERFWAIPKPVPSSYGHWEGEKGDGVFYFDGDYLPADKNTRNGMTWAELVAEYKKDFHLNVDGGVRYSHSRIDLKPYAVAAVKIRYEDSDLSKLRNRGGSGNTIQEIAAPLFEKALRKEIAEGGYADFWEYKDGMHDGEFVRNTPLVIHEDYDGQTLYLVPKYLHDNWKHYGGVALVGALIEK